MVQTRPGIATALHMWMRRSRRLGLERYLAQEN
jgi:hypothetical protein